MSHQSARNRVSIVLTTLNAATYLRQAIDSCLGQTHKELELLVVDGGSTDDTIEIVRSVSDPRIRLIEQESNSGKLPGAINLGLDNASGDYLTWMQGDSYYTLDALETMVEALEQNPDAGQVYADFFETDADGTVITVRVLPEPNQFLHSIGDPGGVCFLIRYQVRQQVGRHNETDHPNHDFDYRMRIAQRFSSVHVRRPLYYWRFHPNSLSGQLGWAVLARKDIQIRARLGLDTPRQTRQLRGTVEIALAFESYQAQKWYLVPTQVALALKNDLRYLRNLGVWSILMRSLARTMALQATKVRDGRT